MKQTTNWQHLLPPGLHITCLPGPTRKREPSPYCYRLAYRNPEPGGMGCALLWEVYGGREVYQIALERRRGGDLLWHCTCADAVYRGEDAPHTCKHVRGLQMLGRQGPRGRQPGRPAEVSLGFCLRGRPSWDCVRTGSCSE